MFSWSISIRNSDFHPIYCASSYNRINNPKSIFLGDHVWIGHDVNVCKETQIDSGSIVGACSLVSGNHYLSNSIIGGVPGKVIKNNVFWDFPFTHDFSFEESSIANNYLDYLDYKKSKISKDEWIYSYNQESELSFSEIDYRLSQGSAEEKANYLRNMCRDHNRFVHRADE